MVCIMRPATKQQFIRFVYVAVCAVTLVVILSFTTDSGDQSVITEFILTGPYRNAHGFSVQQANLEVNPVENISDETAFRIQFSLHGRCVGISAKNELIVDFCNPNKKQAFVYHLDNTFRSPGLGLCVGLSQNSTSGMLLHLVSCGQAIQLELENEKLMHKKENTTLCLSARRNKASAQPDLATPISLSACDKMTLAIQLLEETDFLKDRAALMLPYIPTEKCDFPACAINTTPPKAQIVNPPRQRCTNIVECVTVVVKTARRPLQVLRLAKSLEVTLNQNLSIVVIDDGPDLHPPEIMTKIAEYPNIRYIISSEEDLGIAEGRNIGVRTVETKYFMSYDDDLVVSEKTNVNTMFEMIESLDASLVGGRAKQDFAGFMHFVNEGETGDPIMEFYPGSCAVESEEISGYPGCYRCDLTTNCFIARTEDLLEVGGWSKELKIQEHKDMFLRLKAAGKKVVYCKDFKIKNVHSEKGIDKVNKTERSYDMQAYKELRSNRIGQMINRFANHWNIMSVKDIEDGSELNLDFII